MQIIYISTSGEKYLRFRFQNMKTKKTFASCNSLLLLYIKEEVQMPLTKSTIGSATRGKNDIYNSPQLD